jgi:hypothetical protein
MIITFDNDNDVIVYTVEQIISYAIRTQQNFVAQVIWWLASVIGLESGLLNHIDNVDGKIIVNEPLQPGGNPSAPEEQENAPDESEEESQDRIVEECEAYPKESGMQRAIATLKSKVIT